MKPVVIIVVLMSAFIIVSQAEHCSSVACNNMCHNAKAKDGSQFGVDCLHLGNLNNVCACIPRIYNQREKHYVPVDCDKLSLGVTLSLVMPPVICKAACHPFKNSHCIATRNLDNKPSKECRCY